jgi:phage/plasmid-like protein (TIGR03299 family)
MAKLPSDIRVIGDDVTQKFLLLSNSHDGNSAVQIKFTPVRVVCQNTLTLALSQGPTLRIPHSKDMNRRLAETAMLLRAIQVRFEDIETTFKAMASHKVGSDDVQTYLRGVFPDPHRQDDDDRYERLMAQARTDRAGAEYLFDQGRGNQTAPAKGTLWAAYNGITEYVDHRRYNNLSMERRWDQLWFGMGYSAKKRAYQIATEMSRKQLHH